MLYYIAYVIIFQLRHNLTVEIFFYLDQDFNRRKVKSSLRIFAIRGTACTKY